MFATLHPLFSAKNPSILGCFRGIFLVLGLFILQTSQATAGGLANVFEIRGTKVDVTADTAADARDKALMEGEKLAFRQLMRRLVLSEDIDLIPPLGREDLTSFVKDIEIAEEKRSSVRYIATLNVRFKESDIRLLLTNNGISFAETSSKLVLILPVFRSAGAISLWDEPNPWREAWEKRDDFITLVPTVLPVGDLADIATIGAEQAAGGDEQRLAAIGARYGVGDVLVVDGTLKINTSSGRYDLDVRLARSGQNDHVDDVYRTLSAEPGEEINVFLARGAREMTTLIDDEWKKNNLLEFGTSGFVAVTISLTGLQDWLVMKKQIGAMAMVKKSELILLTRNQARVNLEYYGNFEQLISAFQQIDLDLMPDGDDWKLVDIDDSQNGLRNSPQNGKGN